MYKTILFVLFALNLIIWIFSIFMRKNLLKKKVNTKTNYRMFELFSGLLPFYAIITFVFIIIMHDNFIKADYEVLQNLNTGKLSFVFSALFSVFVAIIEFPFSKKEKQIAVENKMGIKYETEAIFGFLTSSICEFIMLLFLTNDMEILFRLN